MQRRALDTAHAKSDPCPMTDAASAPATTAAKSRKPISGAAARVAREYLGPYRLHMATAAVCALVVHTVARGLPDWNLGGRALK